MPRVIRSTRVLLPDGLRAASLHLADGIIARVAAWDDLGGAPAEAVHDAGDHVVMAGIVDTHVHVNEPGRTEWEGFATATRAARAGGVTTLLDMPLNSIPATTSLAGLEAKQAAAAGQCVVNVGFLGGVIPGNVHELEPLANAGVFAFKAFMVPSGVDEFPGCTEADLRAAFPTLARLGKPLMAHAEDPSRILPPSGNGDYATYLASRPVAAEVAAIEMLVRLVEWMPLHVHVVHVSSAEGADVIRRAKAAGLPITAETCPHYLTWSSEDIPAGATEYKCAPPLREARHREALWDALMDGTLDMIVSDHSPCPPAMKASEGDFFAAWGGIASLQLGLPAVWTGASARGASVHHLSRWMCEAPARLAGLSSRKGSIAPGLDADFVAWNPEEEQVVHAARLEHRHKLTPYAGRRLRGVVSASYIGGSDDPQTLPWLTSPT
ncbi:MAG: allantoinase [Gemmatimonadetes bacterium]|nr:allantoinase [Gemmatimonadota bacterium]